MNGPRLHRMSQNKTFLRVNGLCGECCGELSDLVKNKGSRTSATPCFYCWRPQGDSNPCCRRERPVSLAGLDDGDTPNLDCGVQSAEFVLIYSKIQIPEY